MSLIAQYDLSRLMGVAIIFFVFCMTLLKVAGLPGLSYNEFSLFLKLAGLLLGGHELARLRQRRTPPEESSQKEEEED